MFAVQDVNITPGHAVCVIDRIIVLIWRAAPTRAGVDALRALLHLTHTRRPGEKWALLSVFEAPATGANITDAVRDALSTLLRDWEKHLWAAGVVVDADGFRASLIRTFVATMNLSNRLEFPTSTERHLDSVARFLAARDPQQKLVAADLDAAVKRLRARWSPTANTPPNGTALPRGYSPSQ